MEKLNCDNYEPQEIADVYRYMFALYTGGMLLTPDIDIHNPPLMYVSISIIMVTLRNEAIKRGVPEKYIDDLESEVILDTSKHSGITENEMISLMDEFLISLNKTTGI